MHQNISIIAARGGSKRLPRKNVLPFWGKPMLVWPIQAAIASGLFSHIYVSTDDEEIAETAKAAGALVPYIRPKDLATDTASARQAVRHMLEWHLQHVGEVESLAHIYPTSPLLLPEDIQKGYKLLQQKRAYVYSAHELSFSAYKIVEKQADGSIKPLFPKEKSDLKSQFVPKFYTDAGMLYWHNVRAFLHNDFSNPAIIEIPRLRATDIDTQEDLDFALLCATHYYAEQNEA